MVSLTLDWLHVVALLGAVQGVFPTGNPKETLAEVVSFFA